MGCRNAKPPWDKPNPKKKSKKLTPSQKAKAKARAKRAGRSYPNWVDNTWASKQQFGYQLPQLWAKDDNNQ